ncbi:DUF5996 family protein [Allosphingosinicella vermicomposti]|uniref:DUF5996 family protein n=1 Tax=Allosphingosinicella vermicomposti TaxID=614671 RepID=UPI000D10F4E0|nr:DUF5996 family protein [Allosphingosinicella vermicomposti]
MKEPQPTIAALHLFSQIVGKVAVALMPGVNHGWQVTYRINPATFARRRSMARTDRSNWNSILAAKALAGRICRGYTGRDRARMLASSASFRFRRQAEPEIENFILVYHLVIARSGDGRTRRWIATLRSQ